jgi:hypothetical protein
MTEAVTSLATPHFRLIGALHDGKERSPGTGTLQVTGAGKSMSKRPEVGDNRLARIGRPGSATRDGRSREKTRRPRKVAERDPVSQGTSNAYGMIWKKPSLPGISPVDRAAPHIPQHRFSRS